MRYRATAQVPSQIVDQTAPGIGVEPIFQKMQARQITAGADAVAITIQLDVTEHTFRGPFGFRIVEHPSECEGNLEERPAIHSVEIDRGSFDVVIDFQGEMFVACADE